MRRRRRPEREVLNLLLLLIILILYLLPIIPAVSELRRVSDPTPITLRRTNSSPNSLSEIRFGNRRHCLHTFRRVVMYRQQTHAYNTYTMYICVYQWRKSREIVVADRCRHRELCVERGRERERVFEFSREREGVSVMM